MSPSALLVLLGCYSASALLLGLAATLVAAAVRSPLAARQPGHWLAWAWLLVGLALVLPWAWRTGGAASGRSAPLEIWNGPRLGPADAAPRGFALRVSPRWASGQDLVLPLPGRSVALVSTVLGAGAALSLGRLLARRRRLARLCAALPVVRQIGRVRLSASDDAPGPFALRAAGVAFVVVPTPLVADSARLRMVVAHEAHHHRRGDPWTALACGVLRALFFWNPLLALWERAVAELQDHACDRHVVRRRRASPLEYARVLLWTAERAASPRRLACGAHGMAGGSAAALTRRILMLNETRTRVGGGRTWLLGTAACALVLGTSWLVQGAVADHRLTRAEVDSLAASIERRSGFVVLVDEGVAATLNGWLSDPDARTRLQAALARMPSYRPMIESSLRAHALPAELLAVALAESGFDNEAHPDRPVERRAAGIWQFLPETARRFGLEVSPARDERLDPGRATEAAAAYLRSLFERYGDWPIAIAAYNGGQGQIDGLAGGATGADRRERVLSVDREHARYVRAVMASLILIESPDLLK